MKNLYLFCLVLLLSASATAQVKKELKHEGVFDYALINERVIHVPHRSEVFMVSSIIRAKSLDSITTPIRHFCIDPFWGEFPFSWSKKGKTVFSIACGAVNQIFIHNIVYRPFETRDSIMVTTYPSEGIIPEKNITVAPLVRYERSHLYPPFMYEREKLREVIFGLSFDIQALSMEKLVFFLRDSTALYVWVAEIGSTGRTADWKELVVYGSPQLDTLSPPMQNKDFYSGQNTHHYAITDTLFFDGHFKVLEQNGEKYIINREHAIIYHMGEAKITPIGRVLVTEDYPKIQGKALFIEDRDHNRFIFFAPVKWEETDLPKPNVYYMKEEEMREYFKYVMN